MRSIILNVGTSCFVRCPGCYNHFASSVSKKNTIKNSEILKFLEELKNINVTKVTVGGGDPLSRKNIVDLASGIKSLGFRLNMDTVGTALLGNALTIFFGKLKIKKVPIDDLMKSVDVIGIPLDGSSNEIATSFRRGRKDFFNEQIKIIDSLIEKGHHVCVNTVLNKNNHRDMENIYEVLKEKKIYKWQIFQFMPIGIFGNKNKEEFLIDDAVFEEAKTKILSKNLSFQVEFKSVKNRKSNYLIVDDSGMAWIPTLSKEKHELGSIKDSEGRLKISTFLKKEL